MIVEVDWVGLGMQGAGGEGEVRVSLVSVGFVYIRSERGAPRKSSGGRVAYILPAARLG